MLRPDFASSMSGRAKIFPCNRPSGAGSTRTTIAPIGCLMSEGLTKKRRGFMWPRGLMAGELATARRPTLISDQIQGRLSPWAKLYDPQRKGPKKYNKGDDTHSLVGSVDEIPRGQGGVIKRGKSVLAVSKSKNGRARAVSASCTHAGCIVTWNNADLTWDCPCHGSIFSTEGQVIHGPATKPLAARRVPKNTKQV